ncbi:MAG: hypothetical protein HC929_17490 [Leptolyngbyaceae cyanobacterium SM2_5_2]|nr:hypothetical protein [Leptolyngbyaceae cyanobacterium SM2_5_2]
MEDAVYEHLQYWRRQEPPHQLIERFRLLFLDGANYPDSSITKALFTLAQETNAEREFKYVLNRCCYTLINLWYTQPRDHWAIPELIALFDDPATVSSAPEVQRIQALVKEFVASDQYAALGRLRQIFSEPKAAQSFSAATVDEQPLAYRIRYYPFLYDNSLLTKDSGQEQKQNISDLRRKAEIDLGIRLARFHSGQGKASSGAGLVNPTLLEQPALQEAIGYYTGKIDGGRTQKDLARWFATYSKTTRSFRDFKEEFVDYLLSPIAAVEPKYSGNHFTRNLRQYLRETLSEFDDQRLNSFILVETCRRVLNFLVVDSPQRPVFRRFRHLLEDIGYTLTMGLLLRVVLFCSAAKPWLERCFSVLFNLHERRFCKEVPWLVTSLEHANVALITNFNDVGYQF